MENPQHPNPLLRTESCLAVELAPIESADELAAAHKVGTARDNELTTILFGQFGYADFGLLPLNAQHAIDAIVGCQWDIEAMITREQKAA